MSKKKKQSSLLALFIVALSALFILLFINVSQFISSKPRDIAEVKGVSTQDTVSNNNSGSFFQFLQNLFSNSHQSSSTVIPTQTILPPAARQLHIVLISDSFTKEKIGLFHTQTDLIKRFLLDNLPPFSDRKDQLSFTVIENYDSLDCGFSDSGLRLGDNVINTIVCSRDKAIARVQKEGVAWDEIAVITAHLPADLSKSVFDVSSAELGNHVMFLASGILEPENEFSHELGHSFGGLYDEYNYNQTGSIDNKVNMNCYQGNDPSVAWKNIVPTQDMVQTCGYTNYYRPADKSIMSDPLFSAFYDAPSQDIIVSKLNQLLGKTDTEAPTVSLNLSASQTVSANVLVQAKPHDNQGIMRVEFWIDGNLVHISYRNDYSFYLNSSDYTNGTHMIQAKAYDGSGNTGTSDLISVLVQNSEKIPDSPLKYVPDLRGIGDIIGNKLKGFFGSN